MKTNLKSQHGIVTITWQLIGICLISAFFLFVGQGCSRSSSQAAFKSAIESVLKQDEMAHANNNSTVGYVRQQDAIDLSNCPPDFRIAFTKHKNAWLEKAIVEQEIESWQDQYDSFGAVVESFFRGMVFDFGMPAEARAAAERIQQHATQASKEIRDTWAEVLGIAIKYGVDTTPYE